MMYPQFMCMYKITYTLNSMLVWLISAGKWGPCSKNYPRTFMRICSYIEAWQNKYILVNWLITHPGNDLAPVDLSSIEQETNYANLGQNIKKYSFKTNHFKMSSAEFLPFCVKYMLSVPVDDPSFNAWWILALRGIPAKIVSKSYYTVNAQKLQQCKLVYGEFLWKKIITDLRRLLQKIYIYINVAVDNRYSRYKSTWNIRSIIDMDFFISIYWVSNLTWSIMS